MFPPPPLQFSNAEIERLKAEKLARLEERRKKDGARIESPTESPISLSRPNTNSPPKPSSRKYFFGKGKQPRTSQPGAPERLSPAAEDRERNSHSPLRAAPKIPILPLPTAEVSRKAPTSCIVPPSLFADAPRKAPVPPRRPARPPESLFPMIAAGTPPHCSPPPPPVPEMSPKRLSYVTRSGHASIEERLIDVRSQQASRMVRSKTNPFPSPPMQSKHASPRMKCTTVAADGTKLRQTSGVQHGKVDKARAKRSRATAALEATLLELDYPGLKPLRRMTEPAIDCTASDTPWKRRSKGETMSQLLDAGFFPAEQSSAHRADRPLVKMHVHFPPPKRLIGRNLPNTPDSILPSPTEVYQRSPMPLTPTRHTQNRPKKPTRTPLAQVALTNVKANPSDARTLLGGLSAILEVSSVFGDSPLSSGATTPVATQIHLRGGSVVTVTPPELTAWQRHLYIQGPIKLPKPVIMPRKNSVASLEPFQDAIDEVYQHALTIPRRRSDDAVIEDVCEWFDQFGFDDVKFDGDTIMVEDVAIGEVIDFEETESVGPERYSTPPPEATVSPLEKAVAKEVIEMSRPEPKPAVVVPPAQTEEMLRARGIARLSTLSNSSGHSRGASIGSVRKGSVASIAQVGEPSMLARADASAAAAWDEAQTERVDHGGFDCDDDVEELDEHSLWVAPAIARGILHKGLSSKETRNPFTKMRRVVATASGMM